LSGNFRNSLSHVSHYIFSCTFHFLRLELPKIKEFYTLQYPRRELPKLANFKYYKIC